MGWGGGCAVKGRASFCAEKERAAQMSGFRLGVCQLPGHDEREVAACFSKAAVLAGSASTTNHAIYR